MLPLCSAPLIALLVAGEDWSLFHVWNMDIVGYHNISYIINASIYLVKGGRLDLMPGVLFHSCCPNFRHTSVMFLDFAFLTWLGVMGTPWQFALNKTPPARPNLGFTICLTTTYFSLGSRSLKGHLYYSPPGQCLSKCWSELESFAAPPQGNVRSGFSCTECSSGVSLRTRYVQLLSGCRRIGRSCWSCFTIVKMTCNRDSESDRVFLGEGLFLRWSRELVMG